MRPDLSPKGLLGDRGEEEEEEQEEEEAPVTFAVSFWASFSARLDLGVRGYGRRNTAPSALCDSRD